MAGDFGIQLVHDCVDPAVDIVFVHGFRGHAYRTWSVKTSAKASPASTRLKRGFLKRFRSHTAGSSSSKTTIADDGDGDTVFWPRDLLPSDVERARILTYGYDANFETVLRRGANNSVFGITQDLVVRLQMDRENSNTESVPIIFVAHSLGGIIVKDALKFSQDQKGFQSHLYSIFRDTHGVIFFGTPHRGSDLASLGQLTAKIAALGLNTVDNRILQALEQGSPELERIADSFSRMLPKSGKGLSVYSFLEGLPVTTMSGKVVEAYSSIIGDAFEGKSTINADHMGICRFSSKDDLDYQLVASVIRRWVNQIIKGKGPGRNSEDGPMPTTVDDLRQRIAHVVVSEEHSSHTGEPPITLQSHEGLGRLIPLTPHHQFRGRDAELTWLKDTFRDLSSRPGTQRIAVLHGMGGIGKTQIALKYALEESDNYKAVFWIDATSETSAFFSYLEVAQTLVDWAARVRGSAVNFTRIGYEFGLGQSVDPTTGQVKTQEGKQRTVVDAVRRWLSRTENSGWLMIFDSADDLEGVNLPQLFPPGATGDMVITSRNRQSTLLGRSLEVQCLSLDDATELLSTATEHDGPGDNRHFHRIAGELGCLPLGLAQAAAYLAITKIKPKEYLDLFRTQKTRLLQYRPVKSAWPYEYTICTTWELSFAELKCRNPNAAHLLLVCSFLQPEDIPYKIFYAASRAAGKRATVWDNCWNWTPATRRRFNFFRRQTKPTSSMEETPSVLTVLPIIRNLLSSDSSFEEATQAILEFSLANSNAAHDGLVIHPLIQTWCQVRESTPESFRLRVEAIIIFARSIDEVRVSDRMWNRLWIHINPCLNSLFLLQRTDKLPARDIDFWNAIEVLADATESLSHEDAAKVYQLLYGWLVDLRGEKHILTLAVQGFLAKEIQLTRADDADERAEKLMRKNLSESLQSLGPDHPDTKTQAFNLAESLLVQRKCEEAIPLFRDVLLYGQANERGGSTIMQAEHGLAMCYGLQGRFFEAVPLLQKIISRLSVDPDNLLMYYTVCGNLAELYSMQGLLHEQETLHLDCYATLQRQLGSKHFLAVKQLIKVASFYSGGFGDKEFFTQDDPVQVEKARAVYDQLFAMYGELSLHQKEEMLGAFRRFCWYTGDSTTFLSTIQPFIEQLEAAENTEWNKRAEATARNLLALTQWDVGLLDDAVDSLSTALKISESIPNFATDALFFLSNMGVVYRDAGRLDEAEGILRHVLMEDKQKDLLIFTNLATVFQAQGRLDEAMQMLTDTRDKMVTDLRDRDISYLLNQHAIACLHEAKGDVDEAIRIAKETFDTKANVLGMVQPATLKTGLMLGRLYRAHGLLEEAKELADRIRPYLDHA